jgi:transcriptional regulator with XRE-family HTH domain
VEDGRVGIALRAVRLRKNRRQEDVAHRAGVSQSTVSDIELGRFDSTSLEILQRVAKALDARIDLNVRWRGGELDRLLNVRHAILAAGVARHLGALGWQVAPEVSFAIYGERGSIDIPAWHQSTSSLLVVEVKTELVDVHETLTVLDRKVRLAPAIARSREWPARTASVWLVVSEGSTNRHRVRHFESLLRSALPASGKNLAAWLRRPSRRTAALTFFSNTADSYRKHETVARRRVRMHRSCSTERGWPAKADQVGRFAREVLHTTGVSGIWQLVAR